MLNNNRNKRILIETRTICSTLFIVPTLIVICAPLAGCGLKTPEMQLSGEPKASVDYVNEILNHIEDELGCTINQLIEDDRNAAAKNHEARAYPWLDTATTKIALKLTVDEKSSANGGLNYSDFLTSTMTTIGKTVITTPRSFVFGANAGGSSDATRIDNSDYTFSVAEAFVKGTSRFDPQNGAACKRLSQYDGIWMNSDLHIKDWLYSRLAQFELHPEANSRAVPDTLTTDITFIIAYNANAVPIWHLVPTSYNTGGSNLFSVARTRTDDVIITIGATKDLATTAQNIQKQNSGTSTAIVNASPSP